MRRLTDVHRGLDMCRQCFREKVSVLAICGEGYGLMSDFSPRRWVSSRSVTSPLASWLLAVHHGLLADEKFYTEQLSPWMLSRGEEGGEGRRVM